MRSFRSHLLILSIMMYSICYAQFQIVHDVPNTTTNPIIQPVILEDGGILTHQWLNNVHTLRKYNQQGGLLWSRSMPGPSLVSIAPTSSGILFCNDLGHTWTTNDSIWWEESHEYTIRITRLDLNGQIEGSELLKKSYSTSSSNWSWLSMIDIAPTDEGGAALLITFDESPIGRIEIVKLSPNYTIEWSRCLGNGDLAWPGTPYPTYTYNNMPNGKITASDGEIYYIEGGDPLNSPFRLAKLDGNGDMLWMRSYVYGNTNPFMTPNDLIVDGSGKIHMDGTLQTSVGRFHFFLRTSSDGELDRADIYRTPYYLQNLQFGIDSEGKRVHRVNAFNGVINPDQSHGLFIADTLGSPAQFLRRDDQIVMPNNVFIPFGGMDVNNDRIALSGLLNHEHVDLAFTTRYEALLTFETDDIFSCFMNDTSFAHIPVPLEIMTTENITNSVSLDVSAYYSVQPDTIAITDLDPEPLDTLCSFGYNLLGVPIGLDEMPGERMPLVIQTLVSQDQPILLNDVGAASIQIWNSNGALIHQRNLMTAPYMIPTAGWGPGLYVVKAMNRTGTPIRMERVMLE